MRVLDPSPAQAPKPPRWLVEDHELGVHAQGPGEGEPLPAAAGELVRILIERPGGEADEREEFLDPRAHSVSLGRAHYRHGLRVPLEEHLLLMAPPRTFKTAFLADVILTYPGPVLATATGVSVVGARVVLGQPPRRDDTGPRRMR